MSHIDIKTREQLKEIIDRISSADSPVGIDAVHVHALIIDKLIEIETRLRRLEERRTEQ